MLCSCTAMLLGRYCNATWPGRSFRKMTCCNSVVTVLLQCCCSDVATLSQCCHSVVAVYLKCCYSVVAVMLPGLPRLSERCRAETYFGCLFVVFNSNGYDIGKEPF
jgi:hypothetical protein